MKRFSNLLTLRPGDDPAAVQRQARLRFPIEAGQSKLALRQATRVTPVGTQLILGVASYSRQELELLDEVEAAVGSGNGQLRQVEVFDVVDCQTMNDFAQFIPGLADVYQTPVLGVLVDGTLVRTALGIPDVEQALRQLNVLTSHPIST